MQRTPVILLLLLSFVAFAVLAGAAQEFRQEPDTIPVLIDGEPILEPFAGGIQWPRLVLADIDSDGDLDLLVGDHDGSVHFYRNVGTAEEARFVPEPAVTAVIKVVARAAPTVADIDNDGDLDIFVGDASGAISFYRNNGSPSDPEFEFASTPYQDIEAGPASFPAFADIDGDSDLDLFIGTGALFWPMNVGGNVHWYRNEGDSEHPEFALITKDFNGIHVEVFNSRPVFADIDSDNDLDLFVGSGGGRIEFYRNEGTAFQHDYSLETETFAGIELECGGQVEFADIDSDGDLDLFVTESYGNIRFYRNVGTVTDARFELVTRHFAYLLNDVGAVSAPSFADIDADGDFDLFVGREFASIHFYCNIGTATDPVFSLETRDYADLFAEFDNTLQGFSAPAFLDIDADGDLDLFVGVGTGELLFYRNTGNASDPHFVRSKDFQRIGYSSHLAPTFADIDNDGDFDLFVRYMEGSAFYLNSGTASNPRFVLVPGAFPSVRVASLNHPQFVDVDDDGDWDLIVSRGSNKTLYLSGGNLTLYRNTGTAEEPNFSLETTSFADVRVPSHAAPAFVDIDGDGDLDLFMGELDGGLYFYRNTE
jgi:hypothetical protein